MRYSLIKEIEWQTDLRRDLKLVLMGTSKQDLSKVRTRHKILEVEHKVNVIINLAIFSYIFEQNNCQLQQVSQVDPGRCKCQIEHLLTRNGFQCRKVLDYNGRSTCFCSLLHWLYCNNPPRSQLSCMVSMSLFLTSPSQSLLSLCLG